MGIPWYSDSCSHAPNSCNSQYIWYSLTTRGRLRKETLWIIAACKCPPDEQWIVRRYFSSSCDRPGGPLAALVSRNFNCVELQYHVYQMISFHAFLDWLPKSRDFISGSYHIYSEPTVPSYTPAKYIAVAEFTPSASVWTAQNRFCPGSRPN